MKIAKVVPIYKKGDPKYFNNYRPVSILPCFSKILEKIVYIRLYNFLLKNDVLYQGQYGFRKNVSTEMAVVEIQDRIISEINENKSVIGIFMDLSKAFDSLSHNILLKKLWYYGVRGTCFEWFKSYLCNRKQCTIFNSLLSEFEIIDTGVPQGSILGLLLFLICINDIVNSCHCFDFISYADDTTLIGSNSNFDDLCANVSFNLTKVAMWFQCNKLSLNVDKTNFVLFQKNNFKKNDISVLKINEKTIKRCHSVTFLGVILDERLNWNEHIDNVSRKISKYIGIMNRLKYELPFNILYHLYNAFILPHLMYCNSIWGNTYSKRIEGLFKLQKKAIRIITKSNYLAHTSPLFKRIRTLTIYDLNKLQILSLMQRFYSRTLSPYIMNMFSINSQIHTYNTRSHYKIHRWKYNNDRSKHTLRNTGPILWNLLDSSSFNLQYNNSFKRQYKNHLLNSY